MYSKGTKTGEYMPKHLEKYIGKALPLIYRSSWERSAFEFFDNNVRVIKWSYESIKIGYMKPLPTGTVKLTYYIPDIYVEYFNSQENYCKELLEIKPKKFTKKSRSKNPLTKMNENYALAVNMAKWEAAKRWCAAEGDVTFKILTEQSLFR